MGDSTFLLTERDGSVAYSTESAANAPVPQCLFTVRGASDHVVLSPHRARIPPMGLLRVSERPEAEPGRPADLSGSGHNRWNPDGNPMPWVASYVVLTVVGCVLTVRWLFPSDRGWSSITAYFDPWYPGAVPLALILLGYALLSVGNRLGVRIPDWMVTTARFVSIVVVAATAVIVLLVPLVIWFVEAVVVPIVLAWLYANRRRIERGQLPRIPRTSNGWLSVAETAGQIRPHI